MNATITVPTRNDERHYVTDQDSMATLSVELPDGRTVALIVDQEGDVSVTAFTSRPEVTGQQQSLSVHFHLPSLSESVAGEQARLTGAFAFPITLDNVITPGTDTWEKADSASRLVATLLRRDLADQDT